MKSRLDMDKIARALGAERGGRVTATAGHFGATQLAAQVRARLRAPATGGRATDPSWTERRLVPLAPETLRSLEVLAERVRTEGETDIQPMQLVALLLESVTAELSATDAAALVRKQRAHGRTVTR